MSQWYSWERGVTVLGLTEVGRAVTFSEGLACRLSSQTQT